MKPTYLASESFGSFARHYFIDFSVARNNSDYIKITRADLKPDGGYKRRSICVFEEDFHFLVESFSTVFSSVGYQRQRKALSASVGVSPEASGIKSWPVADRPREKMISGGPSALCDVELLALLIGSGTTRKSAVDLANEILEDVNHDLNALAQMTVKDLRKYKGIGAARATIIVAALELNERMVSARMSS